jgi:hypothetical protein
MFSRFTRKHLLSTGRRFSAKSLVVAEHDGKSVSQSTLACVTAASKLGGEVKIIHLKNCYLFAN